MGARSGARENDAEIDFFIHHLFPPRATKLVYAQTAYSIALFKSV